MNMLDVYLAGINFKNPFIIIHLRFYIPMTSVNSQQRGETVSHCINFLDIQIKILIKCKYK